MLTQQYLLSRRIKDLITVVDHTLSTLDNRNEEAESPQQQVTSLYLCKLRSSLQNFQEHRLPSHARVQVSEQVYQWCLSCVNGDEESGRSIPVLTMRSEQGRHLEACEGALKLDHKASEELVMT